MEKRQNVEIGHFEQTTIVVWGRCIAKERKDCMRAEGDAQHCESVGPTVRLAFGVPLRSFETEEAHHAIETPHRRVPRNSTLFPERRER